MRISKFFSNFSSGNSFIPSSLSSVRFWFDGDNVSATGSNVDSLTNRITGEADAIKVSDGTRPQILSGDLNGHDVIDFNGTDQRLYINITDWQSIDHTWFIVFKSDDPTSGTRQTLVDCWSGSSSGFHIGLLSSQAEFFMRSSTVQAFTDTASYHVIMVKSKHYTTTSGNNPRVFKVDNGTAVNSLTSTFANLAFNIGIGGRQDGTLFFNGKIAEIIGCEDVITETDEVMVYQYLNQKYGLNIPTTMPEYTFNSGSLTYSSTYDSITDLNYQVSFSGKTFGKSAPMLVMMHGYSDDVGSYTTELKNRMSNLGLYLVMPSMRERSGAGGTRDSSGREILDIYDAVNARLAIHSDLLNSELVSLNGGSGGGGNAIACGAKMPESFAIIIDDFGMTDYIFNYNTNAWFEQATVGGPVQQQLELDILGAADRLPQDYLNEAKSRDHRYSHVKNYEGYTYIFHDSGDTAVEQVQSDELWAQFVSQGRTALGEYHLSTPSDANRFLHGYHTSDNPGLVSSEAFWLSDVLSSSRPTAKTSGTYRISGFLKNRSFEIFLGLTVADGKSCEADLTFNYNTNTYTITPIFYGGETQMVYSFEDILGRTSSGTITGATQFSAT